MVKIWKIGVFRISIFKIFEKLLNFSKPSPPQLKLFIVLNEILMLMIKDSKNNDHGMKKMIKCGKEKRV